MIPDPATALEELTQFVYLAPVGIIRFAADGAINMINPMAAQLLMPLTPGGDLANAYVALAPVAPDLRSLIAVFTDDAGAVLTHHRCEVDSGKAPPTVISLTVNRVAATVYMAIVEDVTQLVEQERLIFEDQQRFQAIFNNIRDYAIFTLDLSGRLDDWNRSLDRFGGWTASDVEGQYLGLLFDNGGAEKVAGLLQEARRAGSTETEGWLKRNDGSRQWANTVITALPDPHGEVGGFVVVARDMSERKRMEDELRRLATTDPLTGAYNRRWGQERLSAALAKRARDGGPVSVLMLDIDHFKSINDRFGHEAGDEALRSFVAACGDVLRPTDALVRWGGEEFLALLPRVTGDGVAEIAERIRARVAAIGADAPAEGRVRFTVSIGLAEANGGDADDLVRRADKALYEAKAGGRNRVVAA